MTPKLWLLLIGALVFFGFYCKFLVDEWESRNREKRRYLRRQPKFKTFKPQ